MAPRVGRPEKDRGGHSHLAPETIYVTTSSYIQPHYHLTEVPYQGDMMTTEPALVAVKSFRKI